VTEAARGAWRPVQFLGSKLRALDSITEAMKSLHLAGGVVWEPFSGSTVVAQSLAASGFRVIAGDALAVSAAFATAVLGVGRDRDDSQELNGLAQIIVGRASANLDSEFEVWSTWLDKESAALKAGDGRGLLRVGAELPQRWRPGNRGAGLDAMFGAVEYASKHRRYHPHGSMSSTYAGTYFGIHQALHLDTIRIAIDEVLPPDAGHLKWSRACMITALAHAASAAVFSPGKHFAQPHRVRDGKKLDFHVARVLTDRSIDIVARFAEAADRLAAVARPARECHHASRIRVEDVSAETLISWGVDIVYADPPYTAQQYSRFYHVLDTLTEGIPAKLQLRAGAVTRGLYPEGRYLSPFCSRVRAKGAIADLACKSAKAGASLVFSYSDSIASATGNVRSVTLSTLVEQLEHAYGSDAVSVQQLTFRYRQFNNTAVMVAQREDPEFLVVARIGGKHAG